MSDTPWNAALNLLARREYSQAELRTKLQQKFPEDEDEIETALERLIDTGLQNDERFAEAFLRTQIARSRGPIRIRHEARRKGIAEQINDLLEASDEDWYELAREAAERKLGRDDVTDPKVKARIARFLAYRGFDTDQTMNALDALKASGTD